MADVADDRAGAPRLVLLVGDMLEHWTNGFLPVRADASAVHRPSHALSIMPQPQPHRMAIASHRIASHRIASHRNTSHRIALHCGTMAPLRALAVARRTCAAHCVARKRCGRRPQASLHRVVASTSVPRHSLVLFVPHDDQAQHGAAYTLVLAQRARVIHCDGRASAEAERSAESLAAMPCAGPGPTGR